jgi:hypothetical protein
MVALMRLLGSSCVSWSSRWAMIVHDANGTWVNQSCSNKLLRSFEASPDTRPNIQTGDAAVCAPVELTRLLPISVLCPRCDV